MKNSIGISAPFLLLLTLSFSHPLTAQNVGINTTTPAAALDVRSINSIQPLLRAVSSDGTERLTILENGNTGIGLAMPTERLHVNGNIRLANDSRIFGVDIIEGFNDLRLAGDPNGGPDLTIQPNGDVGIGTGSPTERLHVNGNILSGQAIRARGGGPGNNGFSFSGNNGDTDGGMFSTADGLVQFFTNNAERVRINSSGNVGIGTISPSERLHVNGNILSGQAIRARGGGPGNNGFSFSGNNGDTDGGMFSTADGLVQFFTDNAERVRINSSGNVGIGTTSPSAPFHVSKSGSTAGSTLMLVEGVNTGTSNYNLLQVRHGGGDNFRIRANGSAGIHQTFDNITFNVREKASPDDEVIFNVQKSNGENVLQVQDDDVLIGEDLQTFGGAVKNFLIDHPLDPENKELRHICIEAPERMNLYRGNAVMDANGEAEVQLPDYFEALNRNYTYQLTCMGGYAPVFIASEIQDNRFRIGGGKPGLKVSWQVGGERHDPGAMRRPTRIEQEKEPEAKGKYYAPEAYGKTYREQIGYQEDKAEKH